MLRYGIIFCCVLLSCTSEDKASSKSTSQKHTGNEDIYNMSYNVSDTIRTRSLEDIEGANDGPVSLYYPNKVLKAEGEILNGKKQSLWKSYYDNGSLWSSTYFNQGDPDGHTISYYRNGTVMFKGQYSKGKRVGSWIFYDEDGQVKEEIDYPL